jgi:hypothetical protein
MYWTMIWIKLKINIKNNEIIILNHKFTKSYIKP